MADKAKPIRPKGYAMVYTMKSGAIVGGSLAMVCDAFIAQGHEVKPLALGLRIGKTGIVVSPMWRGFYLCKSCNLATWQGEKVIGEGEARAMLKPADKGQFRVCFDVIANDSEQAQAQAVNAMALLASVGYASAPIDAPSAPIDAKPAKPTKRAK
jgi:hypothetical protein